MVKYILDYGGQKRRNTDLFGTQSPMSITRRFFKGLNGVENIFTQHSPLLAELLDHIVKSKLKESQYPFLTSGEIKDRLVYALQHFTDTINFSMASEF